MKSAKLTTTSGHTWTTSINGTDQEITNYFLNKFFDVGVFPEERMEEVVKVEVLS